MARFLADEDFDFAIVEALRVRGHEVIRHQEIGEAPRGELDPQVLARARAEGLVLLTHNRRDFVRIHRSGVAHAGILALPQHPDTSDAAARIDALVGAEASLTNRLFKVNRLPVVLDTAVKVAFPPTIKRWASSARII